MNFSEKEKIRRQLYKNEEQKKKRENLEKLNYPTLNGFINKENIEQYLLFDKEEENTEKYYINGKENIQVEYDVVTYMTNEKIPDLYTPYGFISGNNYTLVQKNDTFDNIEYDLLNDSIEKDKNKDNNNCESNKTIRYYNMVDDDVNGIKFYIKKKKCNRCGNINCNCKNPKNFCYICLSPDHTRKDCPKTLKCYKCLKLGHLGINCTEQNLLPCESCKKYIHKKEDCLRRPLELKKEDIKENKLKCVFCGKDDHLLCPYIYKVDYILLYSRYNEKNKNNLYKEETQPDFSQKLYCPNCGDPHLKSECPERKDFRTYSDRTESKSKSRYSDSNNINNFNINEDFWGSDKKNEKSRDLLGNDKKSENSEDFWGNGKKSENSEDFWCNGKKSESSEDFWGNDKKSESNDIKRKENKEIKVNENNVKIDNEFLDFWGKIDSDGSEKMDKDKKYKKNDIKDNQAQNTENQNIKDKNFDKKPKTNTFKKNGNNTSLNSSYFNNREKHSNNYNNDNKRNYNRDNNRQYFNNRRNENNNFYYKNNNNSNYNNNNQWKTNFSDNYYKRDRSRSRNRNRSRSQSINRNGKKYFNNYNNHNNYNNYNNYNNINNNSGSFTFQKQKSNYGTTRNNNYIYKDFNYNKIKDK